MSHLARGYSIIIDEVRKNVNENGVQVDNQCNKHVPKITQKMLSKNLKELEDDDLINRKTYDTIPQKVEYSLTEHGKELIPIIDSLHEWGIEHRKHIQKKWLEKMEE